MATSDMYFWSGTHSSPENLTKLHCQTTVLFQKIRGYPFFFFFFAQTVCKACCFHSTKWDLLIYRIRPNYRTVCLGFSKLQDTLICGQICIYLLRIHYKKDQKRTCLMMTMRFFLTFFTRAYVMGTHLNCIDLSMQFKWVPTTYAFVKK